jgi:hypothetical protein
MVDLQHINFQTITFFRHIIRQSNQLVITTINRQHHILMINFQTKVRDIAQKLTAVLLEEAVNTIVQDIEVKTAVSS